MAVAYQTAGQEHSVIAARWAKTGPILQVGKLSLREIQGLDQTSPFQERSQALDRDTVGP